MRRHLHQCYGRPVAAAGFTGTVGSKKIRNILEVLRIPHLDADLDLTFTLMDPDPTFYFDPDSTFHFGADLEPDPAPPRIDAILRPLVYRPSTPALSASTTLHGSIFSLYHS
jgi:hypothetical protein